MMTAWVSLRNYVQIMENGGIYWKLGVFAAVCCLLLSFGRMCPDRDVCRKVPLGMLILMVLLLNPLTVQLAAGAAVRYGVLNQTVPVGQLVNMVPMLPLIAIAAALAAETALRYRSAAVRHEKVKKGSIAEEETDMDRRAEVRTRICVTAILTAVILSAGTVMPYLNREDLQKKSRITWNKQNPVMQTVLELSGEMEQEEVIPILAAPKGIMDVIRQYDGQIILAYGRDLWQTDALTYLNDGYSEAQIILCQQMEADTYKNAEVAELALQLGCNVIVLREELSSSFTETNGLQCRYAQDGYYVYARSRED